MSKLADQDKFLDFSDYGRPFARLFVKQIKNTSFTPIHVTMLFGLCGLIAVYFILTGNNLVAALFLVLKSIIDAADGELARVNKAPSFSGRYLDSIFDITLNFLIFASIYYVSETNLLFTIIAFIGLQLQGTLYNYYYVILRNNSVGGDITSKIFENNSPVAFLTENQKNVDTLFYIYSFLYGIFDKIIHLLDKDAVHVKYFPNWFMTLLSVYGLGFQLLIIAVMLSINLINYIIPFFIFFSILIFIIIGVRKIAIKI